VGGPGAAGAGDSGPSQAALDRARAEGGIG
jgi:hypothetical protein